MKAEYWPDVDMLHLSLTDAPYKAGGGEDTNDPDVVLHFDAQGRLMEVEVSNASKRIDLKALQGQAGFEEIRERVGETARGAAA